MELAVIRVDHVYLSVRDLAVSERFYDPVMEALGFRKGTRPIAGEPHLHYFNRAMQYTLRPARSGERADPYGVGALHHLCFQLPDRGSVDEAQRRLRALGVDATEPQLYPDYRPDYYATFFSDPDGIRLELVCDSAGRRLVRERWHELDGFVDPVVRLLERDAAAASGTAVPNLAPASVSPALVDLLEADVPATGERFEELARFGSTRIERIVSSASPGGEPYDQSQDEWVLLLRGQAALEVSGQRVELRAGDSLRLPAHTVHRVLSTSAGAIWLAVHVDASRATEAGSGGRAPSVQTGTPECASTAPRVNADPQ
jgi:glyoxylase I family protein